MPRVTKAGNRRIAKGGDVRVSKGPRYSAFGVFDSFAAREVADDWGTAEIGGTWVTSGGGEAFVEDDLASHLIDTVNVSTRTTIGSATYKDVRLRVRFNPRFDPAGGSCWCALLARHVNANDHYIFRTRIQATSTSPAQIMIQRSLSGVLTTVAAEIDIPGAPNSGTGNEWWWIAAEITGTTLRMKSWRDVDPEPGSYQLTGTDAGISGAHGVGVRTILSSSVSNTLPVQIDYDSFMATKTDTPTPELVVARGSVATPSVSIGRRATPGFVAISGSVLTPDIRSENQGSPEPTALASSISTFDASPRVNELGRPAVMSATGAIQAPVGKTTGIVKPGVLDVPLGIEDATVAVDSAATPATTPASGTVPSSAISTSSDASPNVVSGTGSVPDPSPAITAAAVEPQTALMSASVLLPSLSSGTNVPAITVVALASVPTTEVVLSQRARPTPVAASASVFVPAFSITATPKPGPAVATGSLSGQAKVSATRSPILASAAATTYGATGSAGGTATPATMLMVGTLYGSIASSSRAFPASMIAICTMYAGQQDTGAEPVDFDGDRVSFSTVISPGQYVVTQTGIRYGRVRISPA